MVRGTWSHPGQEFRVLFKCEDVGDEDTDEEGFRMGLE